VGYVNEIQRHEEKIAQDKLNQIIQIEQSIEGAEDLGLSSDANRYIGTSTDNDCGISRVIVRISSSHGRGPALSAKEEGVPLHDDPLQ